MHSGKVLSLPRCVVLAESHSLVCKSKLVLQTALRAFRPRPYSKRCSPCLPAQPLLASGGCRRLRCFSAGGVTVGLIICGV